MSVPSRVTSLINKNSGMLVAAVDTVEGNAILMTLYTREPGDWHNNYRPYIAQVSARVVRDKSVRYQKEGSKTFTESAFVTGKSSGSKFEFAFKSKKEQAAAEKFFGTDPCTAILALEQTNIRKKQEAKLRRSEREYARMESLFNTPIASDEAVLERGKELAPGYMIVNDHIGWCTKCGHESPVRVSHSKMMSCPECGKTVKTIYPERRTIGSLYDSYWIIVPDIRSEKQVVSYYRYSQSVSMDKKTVSHRCSEQARGIGIRGKNRECWCKSYTGQWCRGQAPYFIQFGMGNYCSERSDWCERGYVIPNQFMGYLRKLCGKTARNVPLDFFINDMNYVWTEEANSLAKVLSEDKDAPRVLRTLVKSGLPKIADVISVSGTAVREMKLNVKAVSAKGLLGLTDSQYEDFIASDRTYERLKQIRGNKGIRIKIPDLAPYAQHVKDRIPANAMNAGKAFIVPRGITGLYEYIVSYSVDKNLGLKETVYVSMNNSLYERVGKRFYKLNRYSDIREEAILLRKDFDRVVNQSLLRYVPKELLNSNRVRKILAFMSHEPNLPNLIRAYEIFKKAGFNKVANEFKMALCGMQNRSFLERLVNDAKDTKEFISYTEPLLATVGKQKLYKALHIPRSVFSKIDRKTATLGSLAGIARVCGNNPGITMEEIKKLNGATASGDWSDYVLIRNGQPIGKTLSYIRSNRVHIHEYDEYVKDLIALGIKLNAENVFPKKFDKEYTKIATAALDSKNPDKVAAMKRIRDALMSDKRVGKFLKQNTRYLVYVPESPSDLVKESKRLNNCLSAYIDRVAEGNTSVFFIRDADNPDAALYAMEVKDGRRIQLHGVNNLNVVEGSPADKFANGFVKLLKTIHFDPKVILQAA